MSDPTACYGDDQEWNLSSNHSSPVVSALTQAYRRLSHDDPSLDDFLEALAVLDLVANRPMPDLLRIQVTLVLAMVAVAEGDAALASHYTNQALVIAEQIHTWLTGTSGEVARVTSLSAEPGNCRKSHLMS